MNIITIDVPDYVNYISEWNELDMTQLQGHIIMDKTITGCGFTEYFLTNTQNVVLCSPRKILLENKSDQHKDKVFYVKNEIEKSLGVDKDLPKPTAGGVKKEEMEEYFRQETPEEVEEKKRYITQLKQTISDYIDQCYYENRPFKILVTYDSIKHVLDVLKSKFTPQAIDTIQFVVDEFQSIFTDSKFKGNVELDFVDYLQDCNNVCYLSATPMIEKYLDRIDEFKNLPYYKLIWDSNKVVKAKIIRKKVKSIIDEAGKIIDLYRKGVFPRKILEDKSIHESKEVVFYVNSVKTICSIVKKFGLTPQETNIICSRDNKNKKKLRQIKHDFGRVPTQTEPHKMFTFCTRTVYLGADFYSKSAYTIIFSDPTIDSLCVDISLDLPQILGRQRLKSNVFRNECLLFYKAQKIPITKERFDKHVEKKREKTFLLLGSYEKLNTDERNAWTDIVKQGLYFKYNINYVSIRSKTDTITFNHLVELSEERAWEVSQVDYQDDITVKRILEEDYIVEEIRDSKNDLLEIYNEFAEEFQSLTFFHEKMKLYCDFLDQYGDLLKTTDLPCVPRDYQNYVNLLGTKRVKALKSQKSELEKEYNTLEASDKIKTSILHNFEVSKFYPALVIKSKLQQIYDSLGVKKKAKATDLGEYYELIIGPKRIDGKLVHCVHILKVKE